MSMTLLFLTLSAFAVDPAPLGRVLAADVVAGKVDYAQVRANAELEAWLAQAASATGPQNHAFYLNTYNALVLRALASRPALPAKVTDIAGFFDATPHKVAGEMLTLNALETRIRAWGDPRIHFALNCGARSCPPLQSSAFPENDAALDKVLESLTASFLDGPGVVVDDAKHQIQLSALFDWYRADFGEADKGIGFILKHLTDPAERARVQAAVAAGYAISYQPYDWMPNSR